MNMHKILQINVCNNVYSTGKIVSAIGDLVIEKGWDSYIAYARGYKESLSVPIKVGNWLDWCLNGIEQRIFDNTGFGVSSYLSTKKLVKQIENINPDIIHIHVIVGYYLHYKVLFDFLSNTNVPIIWTLHSCWEITGHCTHFSYEGCSKWKTECFNCPLKKEYPSSFIFDRSRKNYKLKKNLFNSLNKLHIVAVSKWLGDVVSDSFLKNKPLHIIYNGIDLNSFYPSDNIAELKNKYNLNGKFVAIGVASTWLPKKGIYDYYTLSKMMSEEIVIIMIGLSDKQIKNLPNNIIGVKKTESIDELREYYTLADVVLNLSYEETFGLTTVEGFACGTPSIVYNCTASPELVTPETGFVVEPGDLESVVKNMRTIQINGKGTYSLACRRRAEEKFNKDTNFKQYIDLYNEMLKK